MRYSSLTKRDVSESLVFPMSLGVGHRENIAHVGFDYSDKINIQGWMKKQSGSDIYTFNPGILSLGIHKSCIICQERRYKTIFNGTGNVTPRGDSFAVSCTCTGVF